MPKYVQLSSGLIIEFIDSSSNVTRGDGRLNIKNAMVGTSLNDMRTAINISFKESDILISWN